MNGVPGSAHFILVLPLAWGITRVDVSSFFKLWGDSPGENEETDVQPESPIMGRVLSSGMKLLAVFHSLLMETITSTKQGNWCCLGSKLSLLLSEQQFFLVYCKGIYLYAYTYTYTYL